MGRFLTHCVTQIHGELILKLNIPKHLWFTKREKIRALKNILCLIYLSLWKYWQKAKEWPSFSLLLLACFNAFLLRANSHLDVRLTLSLLQRNKDWNLEHKTPASKDSNLGNLYVIPSQKCVLYEKEPFKSNIYIYIWNSLCKMYVSKYL